MATKKESSISLLTGKISFTDEPLWYRLIVIIIVAIFIIAVAWALKEWAIPTLAVKGINLEGLLRRFSKVKPP